MPAVPKRSLADDTAVAGSGVLTGAMGATRLEADLAGRTLLTLSVADGGSEHCHGDNRIVGTNYIADWLADTLTR